MQTLVQVFCNPDSTNSLRKKIASDPSLEDYYLALTEFKRNARSKGWAKIQSTRGTGVINIEWDTKSHMLYARVINKASGTPEVVMSDFIEYLFANHREVIKTVNILPIN